MDVEYRVSLASGKYGYGPTSFLALCSAVGSVKANIISDNTRIVTERGEIVAKNGVTIGWQEKRLKV